jgi:hypothetical protein
MNAKIQPVSIPVTESVRAFNLAIATFDAFTNYLYQEETNLDEIARICRAIVCPKLAKTIVEGGKALA